MADFKTRKPFSLTEKSRTLYHRILTNGIRETGRSLNTRNIVICNVLSLVLILTTLLMYAFVYAKVAYLRPISWFFIIMVITFAAPLFLNSRGYYKAARFVLSVGPSVLTIIFSILSKVTIDSFTFNDYHNFRIALIVLCVLPFFLFSLVEKISLFISFLISFSCLALTDVVHHLFNVGYYDIGFKDTHYGFINFFSMVSAFPIVFGIVFFKGIIEKQNAKNEALVLRLMKGNRKILQQNNTLQEQKEKLEEREKQLKNANDTITQQKYFLENELAMYDHEVSQFSYNVCHHLRGPASSLEGLVIFLEKQHTPHESLLPHFKTSVSRLNQVISDLNETLNIRRDILRIKSHVSIANAFDEVLELLAEDIEQTEPVINIDVIGEPSIFAPRNSIINILFNLISNSVKYRDPSRQLRIDVRSYSEDAKNIIEITDNGLGIDMERFGNDLFKMYRRFHLHTEGKGLGLYLVKLQLTALGGAINVRSEVGVYTRFTLVFQDSSVTEPEAVGNTRFDLVLK